MIRLIALLGNPGKEYERTRHNAAWLLAEYLAFASGLRWQEKFKGLYAVLPPEAGVSPEKNILVKPLTFMNLCGECVQKFMAFHKIAASETMAVHDELELPFGTLGFRRGGGLGGHNGLRSLAKNLGTQDFYRFRIGIGRPARGDAASHVLGRFSREEEAVLEDYLRKAAEILRSCAGDPAAAEKDRGKITVL